MTLDESLEHLLECLRLVTEDVGFVPVPELPSLDDAEPPPGCCLWCSDYAVLVLCPVPPEGEEVLKIDAIEYKVRDWMYELLSWVDGLISRHENTGRLMDAYLLLALGSKPENEELQEAVRRIELDTSLCRKHVLWPVVRSHGRDSWNDRLARVTPLALPAPPAPARPAASPGLPARASEALAVYQRKNRNKAAALRTLEWDIDQTALESE